MTPLEQENFVDAYANNVADAPREYVADFVARCEAGEDIPYGEYYTSIMDALGVWHSAKLFYSLYFKALEREKANG
jgi:hypothetical protein